MPTAAAAATAAAFAGEEEDRHQQDAAGEAEAVLPPFLNDAEMPMRHPSEFSADGTVARTYTTRCKKALVQRIQTLDNTDHEEIFAKLKAHGIPHSQNTNGAFVNLTFVPCGVIAEIDAFVDYCTKNQRALDEYDMKLNACKLHQKYDTLLSIHDTTTTPAAAVAEDNEEEEESDDRPPEERRSTPPPPSSAAGGEEEQEGATTSTANPAGTANTPQATVPNPKKVSTKFLAAKKKFAKKKGGGEGGGGDNPNKGKKSANNDTTGDTGNEELTPE